MRRDQTRDELEGKRDEKGEEDEMDEMRKKEKKKRKGKRDFPRGPPGINWNIRDTSSAK